MRESRRRRARGDACRPVAAHPRSRYDAVMTAAAKLLADALALPETEREDLAALLLDSIEPPPGISIEDEDEIRRRAQDARDGVPGIPWSEVKRSLVK
jgi:putative addiction module component (TIGR02574 family)